MITLGGTIKNKVNLVLRIFNDYNMKEVRNPIITLNGMRLKKISKSGGYHVFVGLEERKYEIVIENNDFITKVLSVDLKKLNPLEPLVNIRLKPKENNFFETEGVILKFSCDEGNRGVHAYIQDFAVGEIIKNIDEKKDILYIDDYFEELIFGETLYIDDGDKSEFIEILSLEKNKCKICEKTKFSHEEGIKLKKAFSSKCDDKGNGLVYFKNLIKKNNKINILIEEENKEVAVNIDSRNTNKKLGKI